MALAGPAGGKKGGRSLSRDTRASLLCGMSRRVTSMAVVAPLPLGMPLGWTWQPGQTAAMMGASPCRQADAEHPPQIGQLQAIGVESPPLSNRQLFQPARGRF